MQLLTSVSSLAHFLELCLALTLSLQWVRVDPTAHLAAASDPVTLIHVSFTVRTAALRLLLTVFLSNRLHSMSHNFSGVLQLIIAGTFL